jgi:hypothetical protein
MADDKKDPKPMNDPEVHVTVTPKNPRDPDHKRAAEKVKETVKEGVKKVVKEAAPGGAKKQLDAADGKIDEAKHGASPGKIDKINVKVKGKDADGDEYHHERTVKPDG